MAVTVAASFGLARDLIIWSVTISCENGTYRKLMDYEDRFRPTLRFGNTHVSTANVPLGYYKFLSTARHLKITTEIENEAILWAGPHSRLPLCIHEFPPCSALPQHLPDVKYLIARKIKDCSREDFPFRSYWPIRNTADSSSPGPAAFMKMWCGTGLKASAMLYVLCAQTASRWRRYLNPSVGTHSASYLQMVR